MNDHCQFFDLDTSTLFEKAKKDVAAFMGDQNDDNLLNALFVLNHLREWIYPPGYEAYQGKPKDQYSREERLHAELHDDPDYRVIRDLCNRAKHVQAMMSTTTTRVLIGLIAGFARAGDRLGQRNYIVDGEDVRVFMERLLDKYKAYFKNA